MGASVRDGTRGPREGSAVSNQVAPADADERLDQGRAMVMLVDAVLRVAS
jgi:hypothetical protein